MTPCEANTIRSDTFESDSQCRGGLAFVPEKGAVKKMTTKRVILNAMAMLSTRLLCRVQLPGAAAVIPFYLGHHEPMHASFEAQFAWLTVDELRVVLVSRSLDDVRNMATRRHRPCTRMPAWNAWRVRRSLFCSLKRSHQLQPR